MKQQNSQPIQCSSGRVVASSEMISAPARVAATNDHLLNVVVERDLLNSRNSSSSSNVSTSSGSYCGSNSSGDDELSSSSSSSASASTPADDSSLATNFDKLNLHHHSDQQSQATPTMTVTTSPPASATSTVTSLRAHPLYKIQEKIRSGGFGHVYKGTRLDDNSPIAIKVVPKDKISSWHKTEQNKLIPMEIELMYRANACQGCIKIIDYIERNDRYLIVMERPAKCIDLWDFINNRGPLNEHTARVFFKQIVHTVLDMKLNGVLHRDIKDENILVDESTYELKLIDFGAGTFYTDEFLNEFQGTRVYSPPEWLTDQSYKGDESTVWSLGVLLYNMIYGDIPFVSDEEIVECNLDFAKYAHLNNNNNNSRMHANNNNYMLNNFTATRLSPSNSTHLHAEVNDLIRSCLVKSAEQRCRLEDLLEHDWLKNY